MTTNNQHSQCKKRIAYAWAKYYESLNDNHSTQLRNYQQLIQTTSKFPDHIKEELKEHYKALKKEVECPICLDVIQLDKLEITGCGHKFCIDCIKKITTCSICRKPLTK